MLPRFGNLNRISDIPQIERRRPESHKGDYGRVLVIGGSQGMLGAACLAAIAALRSGAGLVTLAVGRPLMAGAAAKVTSALTYPIERVAANDAPSLGALQEVVSLAQTMDAVALGPGLGRHYSTEKFVHAFVRRCDKPMVIDADALNALATCPSALNERAAPTVITPHPGEMARLCACRVDEVNARREPVAAEFAKEHRSVVVLKGHGTVVSDGERVFVNPTGNPGMATGGAGDVLTGAIAALLGRGMDAFDAAVLGTYLHGLAGDIACGRKGENGMIASDILRALPHAFRMHEK